MQSHIFGSHSVTNGWVTMYDKNKIEEIFKTLGLESKEKRQVILSQSSFRKTDSKPKYRFVLDNATTVNEEEEPQDARLE
jgi:hypothetical protein